MMLLLPLHACVHRVVESLSYRVPISQLLMTPIVLCQRTTAFRLTQVDGYLLPITCPTFGVALGGLVGPKGPQRMPKAGLWEATFVYFYRNIRQHNRTLRDMGACACAENRRSLPTIIPTPILTSRRHTFEIASSLSGGPQTYPQSDPFRSFLALPTSPG